VPGNKASTFGGKILVLDRKRNPLLIHTRREKTFIVDRAPERRAKRNAAIVAALREVR